MAAEELESNKLTTEQKNIEHENVIGESNLAVQRPTKTLLLLAKQSQRIQTIFSKMGLTPLRHSTKFRKTFIEYQDDTCYSHARQGIPCREITQELKKEMQETYGDITMGLAETAPL